MAWKMIFRDKRVMLAIPSVLLLIWGFLVGAEPEIIGEALGRVVQFSIVIFIFMLLAKGVVDIFGKVIKKKTDTKRIRLTTFWIAVALALGAELIVQEYLNLLANFVSIITLYIWQFYEIPSNEGKQK